ncbi:serine hydrolase domain-containing protein [Microbacterium aurantiacum]|uniref:serine hydrolase domain-containing protein n=1 Tax=Microbacterium aurantiacum TaxID=162393 RepID=UPI000C803F76|nr:serine hydrolase domain-containing protein [Microbacterium aurantiacum]
MTRSSPLAIGSAVLAAALVLAAGLISTPPSPRLQPHTSGDPALARAVEHAVRTGGALDRVSVGFVDLETGDRTLTAGFGADDDTEYEIGSVTKTFTGNLFAIAIERGEVTPTETLAAVFPVLEGTPAGGVTLESLSNHHSGLPGLDEASTPRVLLDTVTNRDPYRGTVDDLLEQAGRQQLVAPGHFLYSNLGMSLLGQALAHRADLGYPELVQERIFDPLQMTHSRIVLDGSEQPDLTAGYSVTGIPQEPWSIGAFAPAGGIRSTIGDMAKYLRALLDGSAPGGSAMDHHLDGESGAEGYAWLIIEQEDGPPLTLHNGQTGGFSSFLVLDRERGRGAVVLSNTAAQLPDVVVDLVTKGVTQ